MVINNAQKTSNCGILATYTAASPDMQTLIESSLAFVQEYMQQYDSSHDMSHIHRVCNMARTILDTEQTKNDSPVYNGDRVILAGLLHDIGDRKYVKPGENGTRLVHDFLVAQGAGAVLAETIQDIVNNVSYSSEMKNPHNVIAAILRHPELAIVQDADRLDALGAVGIGRCFTYNATVSRQGSMHNAYQHFEDKLIRLEGMMKTKTGKTMAAERTHRIRLFREWWQQENDFTADVLKT